MSLIGALTKAAKAGEAAKKTAPFYSAVDEALANIARPKGTGAEFLTELSKQPGVKKAELADRKLEQAFKAKGKMTKEEAQQILKDNPPPRLQERQLTEIDDRTRQRMLEENLETSGYDYMGEVPARRLAKWNEEIDADMEKFGDYKTAGGKNYREILLKLPEGFSEAESNRLMALEADMRRSELPAYKMQELLALQAKKQGAAPSYQSSHWKEDPNVLAHMRVQDRTGPNGEKILHVEEIQSDWHQEGRKKGYATGKEEQDYVDYLSSLELRAKNEAKQDFISEGVAEDKAEVMASRLAKRLAEDPRHLADYFGADVKAKQMELNKARVDARSAIPDAPFKKNWHELAMKRLLNYAADNGYDSIAITPGAEQAKRFSLSKQLNEVMFDPNTGHLSGRDHNGKLVVAQQGVTMDNLPDYIGKEGAQKILQTPIDETGVHALRGADLEVGGEGMKGFYDQILPSYLNTFGKPYGAQVQQLQIPIKHELQGLRNMGGYPEEPPLTMHNFPITPEMRESIKQKGLPLYQQIGIPTAGAGAASQMLEPEEESGLATGGIVKSAVKQAQLAKLAKMRQEMAPRAEAVKALIARDENRYLSDVVPNSLTNAEIEAEIKRMAAKAPMIMKPSALTELRKIVEQEKGGYGARRLDRAADEIPNLEKLYNERALKDVFTGDNARALMTMNPADFEKYAARLSPRNISVPGFNGDKQRQSTEDYVKYLTSLDRFDDVPFLLINKEEQGLPLMPFISGHEGRHRNRSLVKRGEQTGLVQLLPRAELREPFPRRSQQEYIEALKEEMEMTGNKVKPESYFDDSLPKNLFIERPPIKLPDIYAKGGSVKHQIKKADGGAINFDTAPDMSDEGRIIQGAPFKRGGKVNMTTNRDTMFLELSNKKLKRK